MVERWCVFLAILMAILMVAISAQERQIEEGPSAVALERARLNLSFATLQRDLAAQGATPEGARDAMVAWREQNQARIDWLDGEARTVALRRIENTEPPRLPASSPATLDGLADEEFVSSCESYLQTGYDACWATVTTIDEMEEARSRHGAWLEREENQELLARLAEARRRIQSQMQIVEPPLLAAELEQLDPEDRIREEIYAAIFEVVRREPLREGEELRDRLAEIDEFVRRKQAELAAIRAARSLEYAQRRVDALTHALAELEN